MGSQRKATKQEVAEIQTFIDQFNLLTYGKSFTHDGMKYTRVPEGYTVLFEKTIDGGVGNPNQITSCMVFVRHDFLTPIRLFQKDKIVMNES